MAARVLLAVGLALTGCATVSAPRLSANPSADLARSGQTAGLPLRDPLEMSPELQALVRQQVGLNGTEDERAHRLSTWLHDAREQFVYAPGESSSAGETWTQQRGDCFAVTNLFVAAARAAHIGARFVYVREVGHYQERGSSFVVSSHVAAEFGPGPRSVVIDFEKAADARTLSDYRPLSDGDAAALFNNNLAVQQLLRGRPHLAERMLRFLIEGAPDLPELRNNLGVALNHEGRPADALDVLAEGCCASPNTGRSIPTRSPRPTRWATRSKPWRSRSRD